MIQAYVLGITPTTEPTMMTAKIATLAFAISFFLAFGAMIASKI